MNLGVIHIHHRMNGLFDTAHIYHMHWSVKRHGSSMAMPGNFSHPPVAAWICMWKLVASPSDALSTPFLARFHGIWWVQSTLSGLPIHVFIIANPSGCSQCQPNNGWKQTWTHYDTLKSVGTNNMRVMFFFGAGGRRRHQRPKAAPTATGQLGLGETTAMSPPWDMPGLYHEWCKPSRLGWYCDLHIYIHICTYIYICICVCICILCMYAYIYIYIQI